jgi:hypothetical protein
MVRNQGYNNINIGKVINIDEVINSEKVINIDQAKDVYVLDQARRLNYNSLQKHGFV